MWRHRTAPLGGLLRARAMAAQPGTASTTRKLHELNVDQTFVRELPGDPLLENSLRQARPRFSAFFARRASEFVSLGS